MLFCFSVPEMPASPETSPLATAFTAAKDHNEKDIEFPAAGDQPSFMVPGSLVGGGVKEEKDDSLVEVYSERLCAVTHAFALCCNVLQKSSGRFDVCDIYCMNKVLMMLLLFYRVPCKGLVSIQGSQLSLTSMKEF